MCIALPNSLLMQGYNQMTLFHEEFAGILPVMAPEQLSLFPDDDKPTELEVQESTVIEREYDGNDNVTKETRTIYKPKSEKLPDPWSPSLPTVPNPITWAPNYSAPQQWTFTQSDSTGAQHTYNVQDITHTHHMHSIAKP